MKLTEEEKKEILESFSWIKVKRYTDDPNLSWEDRYRLLEEHHKKETEFLIGFIRRLIGGGQ